MHTHTHTLTHTHTHTNTHTQTHTQNKHACAHTHTHTHTHKTQTHTHTHTQTRTHTHTHTNITLYQSEPIKVLEYRAIIPAVCVCVCALPSATGNVLPGGHRTCRNYAGEDAAAPAGCVWELEQKMFSYSIFMHKGWCLLMTARTFPTEVLGMSCETARYHRMYSMLLFLGV